MTGAGTPAAGPAPKPRGLVRRPAPSPAGDTAVGSGGELPIQAKRTIGQAGDALEVAADQVADRVLRAPDPSSPPPDRLTALRNLSAAWQATVGVVNAEHDPQRRVAAQQQQLDTIKPFIDQLRAFPASERFKDDGEPQVVDNAVAAFQLAAAMEAHGQLGDPSAETAARKAGALPSGEWCGAFAYEHLHGGGLDPEFRGATEGTEGLVGIFTYRDGSQWIWSGTEWLHTADYHTQRGSRRAFTQVGAAPDPKSLDIRPGDIVLIDNYRGTRPDHIRTCVAYDPTTGDLTSVGGNEGTNTPNHAQIGEGTTQVQDNTAPVVATGAKASRLFGFGRWSAVDFETHNYSHEATRPPRPPAGVTLPPKPSSGGS